jgi:hypothetical protein
LGGSNWNTPSDRIKVTDLNDTFDAGVRFQEKNFKNQSQLLFNSAYIGFNSKLNVATGVPNLKNIEYDAMLTDTASVKYNLDYISSDKLYNTLDNSAISYYVVIEASSFNTTDSNIRQVSSGKWIVFDSTFNVNAEVQRALVWQTLLSTGRLANFSGVTAIKVSNSGDVGYRGYKHAFYGSGCSVINTFDITTGNTVSSWSKVYGKGTDNDHAGSAPSGWGVTVNWSVNQSNVLNEVSFGVGNPSGTGTYTEQTSDEIGTDKSTDEQTNPADYKLSISAGGNGLSTTGTVDSIFLTKGSVTSGTPVGSPSTNTLVDYYTDYSIPETTLAGSLATEGVENSTLIFQTSDLDTINDCIATWNASIDSENTLTVSISADGTNYEEVTDATLHRFTDTGTNLYIKFEIDRVNTSAVDKISEYAILYNVTE